MPDKEKPAVATPTAPAPAVGAATVPPVVPPRRSPGHRGADVKDTVAEMAAKAHEISLEAGSKMAAAMKDVVGAAAGLTGLVLESARDLLQYMVRRGPRTRRESLLPHRPVPPRSRHRRSRLLTPTRPRCSTGSIRQLRSSTAPNPRQSTLPRRSRPPKSRR
jgi:hypothetical protein